MNSKYIIIVVVVGLAALGLFAYSNMDGEQAPQDFVVVEEPKEEGLVIDPAPVLQEEVVEEDAPFVPQVAEQEEADVLPADASLEKRFEFTLNTMLKDVAEKTREYQTQRKVMQELVRPDNFLSAEDLEENMSLFQETVSQLYAKSSEILGVFEKADADIKALAAEKSEEGRAVILDQWNALKKKDAGSYQKFFELESDVIKAHDRLMRFYFTKQAFYRVNADTGEIEFANENDERLARKLQLQINRMERAQTQALNR